MRRDVSRLYIQRPIVNLIDYNKCRQGRLIKRPCLFLYHANKARDHQLRTLRRQDGMQGKRQCQMPVQRRAIEFERNAIYQRELRGLFMCGLFGGGERGISVIAAKPSLTLKSVKFLVLSDIVSRTSYFWATACDIRKLKKQRLRAIPSLGKGR